MSLGIICPNMHLCKVSIGLVVQVLDAACPGPKVRGCWEGGVEVGGLGPWYGAGLVTSWLLRADDESSGNWD